MTAGITPDVAIIGAGPAGGHCALSASKTGLDVCLIDEAADAGGQIWRAPLKGLRTAPTEDGRAGDHLRERLRQSDVQIVSGHRVWSVIPADLIPGDPPGFIVSAVGPDGPVTIRASRLVAATGAHERIVPFPGWTLPGVMGLAAATILLKSHGVVPGARMVVAGAGPLLLAVAADLVKAGTPPVAVVDLDRRRDWMGRAPSLLAAPHLAARGLGWLATVMRADVPIHHGASVRRAHGADALEAIEIGPVDRSGAPSGEPMRIETDTLLVGHGLTPGGEIAALLGAQRRHDLLLGGFATVADDAGRTSVPGLYAIGDGAGVRGAAVAEAKGVLCGLALARDAGRAVPDFETAACHAILRRQMWFADAIGSALALREGQVAAIPPETVVCRCEDVTRAEIDAAVDDGAEDVNQMKHFTRCGMGPCQGRMCGEVAATLIAERRGVPRPEVGTFTPRPPLRPVALDDLVGDFDYADIPIPEPAPL